MQRPAKVGVGAAGWGCRGPTTTSDEQRAAAAAAAAEAEAEAEASGSNRPQVTTLQYSNAQTGQPDYCKLGDNFEKRQI